jgi:hypothetical protein
MGNETGIESSREDGSLSTFLRDSSEDEEPSVDSTSTSTSTLFRPTKDLPVYVTDKYEVRQGGPPLRRSHVVDIGSSTSECPNCGARLKEIALPEDTKRAARVALMRVVSAASITNCKNLEVGSLNDFCSGIFLIMLLFIEFRYMVGGEGGVQVYSGRSQCSVL